MCLNTPQEIAAWVSERKKRYPTKSRIAEAMVVKAKAQQEAGDSNPVRQGKRQQKRGANESYRAKQSQRAEQNRSDLHLKPHPQAIKRINGERRSDLGRGPDDTSGKNASGYEMISSDGTSSDDSLENGSISSDSSSEASGSSGEGPTERSSKVSVPALESLKPRPTPDLKSSKNKVCRYMLKSGKCRMGDQCLYRHDILSDEFWSSMNGPLAATKNKTLSLHEQLMVQQNDQEDREILQCITYLGNKGLLDGKRPSTFSK